MNTIFPKTVYVKRRARLARMMQKDSIAVVRSAPTQLRNGDNYFPYRQDSSFYYLTGFTEPESVLVVTSGKKSQSILFCQERNRETEQWTGRQCGPSDARKKFGFTQTYLIRALGEVLPKLLQEKTNIYVHLGEDTSDEKFLRWLTDARAEAHVRANAPIHDVEKLIGEMRVIKEPREIAVMRRAARISAAGHTHAMRACKPGMMEYELAAEIESVFRRNGGDPLHAYQTIAASGENACTLHYTNNNARTKSGDLILIDAGCELDLYASDITRTFPVSGVFSKEQRALYEVVLRAQEAAIAAVSPGKLFVAIHNIAARELTAGLVRLGILTGNPKKLIKERAYRHFFMHGIGHFLGLDVHDAGEYIVNEKSRMLSKGMVITIEPGIYIAPDSVGVDKKWLGIGIRIEDNVLVTKNGHEVLTRATPKTIKDIEAVMRKK